MEPLINPERIEAILVDCLFRDGEPQTDPAIVDGIVRKFGFHPGRLQSHRAEILTMLSNLPPQFRQSGGGGWTFLNACNDKNGTQWTGMQQRMEELFCLGMAIGAVQSCAPREIWPILPGGMPYYVVLDADLPASGAEAGVHGATDG